MKKYVLDKSLTSPRYMINTVKYCFNSLMQLCMSKHVDVYIFTCTKQLSVLCPQLAEDLNTEMPKLIVTYFALFVCG